MINLFPCWDIPAKCFIHSPNHSKQIGCTREGSIFATENRLEWEEWLIFPLKEKQSDGSIACHIKSSEHAGLFLASASDGGGVSAMAESSDWNKVWYVNCLQTGDYEGGWFIRSKQTNRYLACDGNNSYTVDREPRGWETWNIEFVTEEPCSVQSKQNNTPAKCFLHSPNHIRQIGCTREGSIFATENRLEWEEWLIFPLEEKQSDGSIACHIKSSEHAGLFLASASDGGGVSAMTESSDWNRVWCVNRVKTGDHEGGWLIRSNQTNRYLACDGNNAYTVDHEPRGWETWNIEFVTGEICLAPSKLNNEIVPSTSNEKLINGVVFPCWEIPAKCFLHSPNHNRQIGCTREGSVFLTENRKGWEEWLIFPLEENQSDGSIACHIKSSEHGGLFLVSASDGGGVRATKESSDLNSVWYVRHLKTGDHEGGWLIRSKPTNRYLACNGNNSYTVDHEPRGWETWNIEFVTGELCLVQSKLNNRFVSCDPWGNLCMKHNSDGWEVWRFFRICDKHGSFRSWNDVS